MIRTLIVYDTTLVRGALAFVLGAEPDIEVIAQVGHLAEVAGMVHAQRPDVTVLDQELIPWGGGYPGIRVLRRTVPGSIVVLVDGHRARALGPWLTGQPDGIGFVAKAGPPGRLVAAVRTAARGEQVVDPELVLSALREDCPLTPREAQVLGVAADGVPVHEIAHRLTLAPGTVRNHLSRALAKTGARTRIEAVRIAHDSGWI